MKKYAIYQGNIGLYEWEYCDTKASIKDYPYIKEDRLPVVINRVGGYHTFQEDLESGFVKIVEIEDGKSPLTIEERYPKNSKDFQYGWIDLEGNTYNTGWRGHDIAADYICQEIDSSIYNGEYYLEKQGWIKTTKALLNNKKCSIFVKDYKITKKQLETLYDLGLHDNEDVQMLIKNSEGGW